MTPIPLIDWPSARPLIFAWSRMLKRPIGHRPRAVADNWVYFSAIRGKLIKVGWTRKPEKRPFDCWRSAHLPGPVEPLLLISDASDQVEMLVKRAARDYAFGRYGKFCEVFPYDSPVIELVGELRCVSGASFFPNKIAARERGPIRQMHCWGCGSAEHRGRHCPVKPDRSHYRTPPRCSLCDSLEHNRSVCPFRDEEAA